MKNTILIAIITIIAFAGINYLADKRIQYATDINSCIFDTAHKNGFNGGLQDMYALFSDTCTKQLSDNNN